MDPISAAASIITVIQLSSKVVGYLNDVKDASKDRAKCMIEVTNVNCLLTTLRFRLEDGDSSTPWYTSVRALAIENGPLDQFKEALELLQGRIVGEGKMRKAGNALIWKFNKEEIASILCRIERLKSLVQVALQMDHFKLSQAIKDSSDIIQVNISTMDSKLDTIRQDHDHTRHNKLLDWISPTIFPSQQTDFISRRQEGTGQWFLNGPEFAGWLRQPKETLFCPGIPGAGKTMIAAIAIDHLLNTMQSSSVGVAYVYCNYKSREEQNATSLLAALLKQLVQAQPSLVEPVKRLYEQHVNLGTNPSLDETIRTLRSVFTNFSTVHVVIDALDECRDSKTRREFLNKLRDLQSETDLRLMVTTRFIPEILNEFKEALLLEIRASNADVRRFVVGQIDRLPKCVREDSTLWHMVQESIVEAVDGMFLLARLHTDSLLDKRTPKAIKSTLAKFSRGSSGLDDAYGEAIQRIKGQLSGDYELAKKVLSWIIYAQRPLTTAEICCALAVEPGEMELDPENLPNVEDLVSVCAGLVVVDEESAIIRLVHYTTQEYFKRVGEELNPSAQLDIAVTCLTYLSFSTLRSGSCSSDQEFEDRLRRNKFLDYVARHWGQHVRPVQDKVSRQACSLLLHSGCVSSATQACLVPDHKYKNYSQGYPKGMSGMHLTAQFGLSSLMQALLSETEAGLTTKINIRNSKGQTPFYFSVDNGHYETVQLLLDKGADVNTQNIYYGNALQVASLKGHKQIVKLLLDEGAEVNAQGGRHGNALQAASERGHEDIVKLLLDQRADVNAHGGYLATALQAASNDGHEQIVKLLIDWGADVNTQGGHYGNALQAASYKGHKKIVKRILDQGANVNARGGYYGNALQAASEAGQEEIVKLLINQGADVNIQGGKMGTALQAASGGGYERVVELLLDNGADVNVQGGKMGNALQAASGGGYERIVKLLLGQGADINMGNSLHAASGGGYEQIVKLLIDQGADVNIQGEYYGNALQTASGGGYVRIVKLLLDHGADISMGNALRAASGGGYEEIVKLLLDHGADINMGNALRAASRRGHERIVQLLLDHGADINHGNALQAASETGHEDIVKLLLDQGANVNAQRALLGTSLRAASVNGHEQTVKLLLDQGADVNAQGGFFGSALQAASVNGQEQTVKLLLDQGADVNAQGGLFGSALQAASARGHKKIVKMLLDQGLDARNDKAYQGN